MIVDTNVFIRFEKSRQAIDLTSWASLGPVFISSVTVSELLQGVHHANTGERKQRRAAFVESIIHGIAVIGFSTEIARLHAEVCASLSKRGQVIGAHDLLIAATARYYDFALLTNNVREFERVPGLQVIPFP